MRDAVASALVLVLGVLLVAPCGWLITIAPQHSSQEWLPLPMLLASTIVGGVGLCGGLGGAWLLTRIHANLAATLLAIVGLIAAIVGVQAVDAANVVFDGSPVTTHRVRFERFQPPRGKSKTAYVIVTADAPDAPTTLSLPLSSAHFKVGKVLLVDTREGALGRKYALNLRPETP